MHEVPSPEESGAVTDRDAVNPERWLDEHGDVLFRYALSRLGRVAEAEDAVQEALVGALANRDAYGGRASERNWLMGILKHKVVDQLRRRHREQVASDGATNGKEDEALDAFFDRWRHWRHKPRAWGDPVAALEKAEFWATFRRCMAALPGRWRAAFSLRVIDQFPAANVSEILGVTQGNFRALLHRARLRLRECLEVNWFDTSAKEKP